MREEYNGIIYIGTGVTTAGLYAFNPERVVTEITSNPGLSSLKNRLLIELKRLHKEVYLYDNASIFTFICRCIYWS
ncbi:hypothetical protein CRENPOLYSF1_1140036 [Crenothrix polyspora]|uniref:Uncharacterized protein n=1 Tax=Crenothrix polyspora TaxID=360316 RepID=A0A1R4H039_9GAMM|nr:hypothetical protein CRENPOLYSF1_1140036 [Crenothrix polyspora]